MYRLLRFNPLRTNSVTRLTLKNESNVPEESCCFCRRLQNVSYGHGPFRYQSTLVNANPVLTKKVRKKRSKRFNSTELLEVSNKATLQRTTKIQMANANDLQKLLEINVELGELYQTKIPTTDSLYLGEHTYDHLTVINQYFNEESNSFTLPTLPKDDQKIISMLSFLPLSNISRVDPKHEECLSRESVIEDEECLEKNFHHLPVEKLNMDRTTDMLDVLPKLNTFQPESLEESIDHLDEDKDLKEEKIVDSKKMKNMISIDLKAKNEIIHKTLGAYVEVCTVHSLNQRAMNAFLFFYSKCDSKKGSVINDIKIFNTLLKGLTSNNNFRKITEVLKIMNKNNIGANLQTYIIILECLGRNSTKHNKHVEKMKLYCKEALNRGFTFDMMMNKGAFIKSQRRYVLEAMKSIDESYEPTYENPVVQYNNELVDNLNHESQLSAPQLEKCQTDGVFSLDNLQKKIKLQIDLEKQGSVTVENIESRGKLSPEVSLHRESLEQLFQVWTETATNAFRRDLFCLSAKKGATNPDVYMKCIPVEEFITIIVNEAKKLSQGSETYSPTVNMLYRELGTKVYERYMVLRKEETGVLDKISSIHNVYSAYYSASHKKLDLHPKSIDKVNSRQKWQWMEYNMSREGATLNMDHREWVPTILVEIGKFLYHIIMHDLMVDVNCLKPNSKQKKYLPAFYTIFRSQGRLTKEEVKPHPILAKLYRASAPETLTFSVNEVPMVCPPVPWTSVHNGGYLITPSNVIRLPNYAVSQKQKLENTNVQKLYPSFDSLNQLAAVPWKVNKQILEVILKVFNSGGSSKLDVPQPPSSLPPPEPPVPIKEMDKLEEYNFFRQKLQYRRKKGEMHSLRCDCLYRLSLANHFKDKVFWLPHNMDFRGRVYPIPPHLNHLGSDLARSMLVFAEPRPLGPSGLDWLKIHLINLMGVKKRDRISDRLLYANECIDLILDSADNPLDGKGWWQDSDEPWQSLATCMEIATAIRSGDPQNFMSHFPVHQDGSCNGLQHYAALGRDKAGGYSVNLCPADLPQDVYSAVVALVEENRQRDAANGMEVAKLLDGFIKRKVIKQTIMTTVYGVTKFGARLQIAKQLKDIEDFPQNHVFSASHYLTTKTFESLRTMFTSTKEIQDWFTECARLISSVAGHHVEWVSPLDLPIVQPYFRFLRKPHKNSVYEAYLMDKYEKPNVMKQKNAFPPNFIHSLDSTHMMLTSLNCERQGLTFVSVHDCFWTHASTVHIMNKICREQFVSLHSQPILEDLSIHLSEKYKYQELDLTNDGSVKDQTKRKLNKVLEKLPPTGDLDITQVRDSIYFFS